MTRTSGRHTLLAAMTGAALAVAGLTTTAGEAGAAPVVAADVIELDGEPQSLVTDPSGRLWVVLGSNSGGNELARLTPAGAVTYVDLDTAPGLSDITVGPGPNLWGTYAAGVVRIPLGNPAAEVATPVVGWGSDPRGITRAPGGRLWAGNADTVWRIDTADPAAADDFPVTGLSARELATDSAGRVWVADASGRLHVFAPNGTFVTRDVGGMVQGVTAGPGGQVLYSNPGADPQHVARITRQGAPRRSLLPGTDPSFSLTRGQDGNYWVGLFVTRQVARVTPSGVVTRFRAFPAPYRPRHMAVGNGVVWVGLQDPGNDGAIGRVRGVVRDRQVAVRIRATRFDADRRGRVAVPLTCPATEASGPCRGRAFVVLGRRVVGSKAYAVAAGRTVRPVVQLNQRARTRLRRTGAFTATLRVRVTDRAGNARTIARSVRVVR